MNSKIEEFYDLIYEIDNKFKRPTNFTEKTFLKSLLKDKKIGNLHFENIKRIAKRHQKPPLMAFYNFFSKQPDHKIDFFSLGLMLSSAKNLYDVYKLLTTNFIETVPMLEKLIPFEEKIKEQLVKISMSDIKDLNFDKIEKLIDFYDFIKEIEIPKFMNTDISNNKICKDIIELYNKFKSKEIIDFEHFIGVQIDLKFIQSEIDHAVNHFKKYEETKVDVKVLLNDIRKYILEERFKFIFDKLKE